MLKFLTIDTPFLPEFEMYSDNPWTIAASASLAKKTSGFTTLELCAGGGGQALGLESAGIEHVALVELDKTCCETLRHNRPRWRVIEGDLNAFDGSPYAGSDIVCGGLPCPPFSVAGKQLGEHDERNLFPALIRVVDQVRPKAVMIENVRGIMEGAFTSYRQHISQQLKRLGYEAGWCLMNACQFGVPQSRYRAIFVALRNTYSEHFSWPTGSMSPSRTVGDVLFDLMSAHEWKGAKAWRDRANKISPTIVGGSTKHGGPDLGPTRARLAWASLGVDGMGIADAPPARDFAGLPRLTVPMIARLQAFPDDWYFAGRKTRRYRQVGNAFPPPFATAIAQSVRHCLIKGEALVQVPG
jgi:DNA (cytosine-5)-methyltransferase 1